MNAEKLVEYLGEIDDEYVREAAPGNRPAKKRWAPLAGAAVLALVVGTAALRGMWPVSHDCDCAPPEAAASEAAEEGPAADGPGCAPGYIHWRGYDYVDHGQAVYEMPEGLEFLGEVNLAVEEGGILPEDAPDLSSNFGDGGSAYMFPGNDSLIVFRYKEWDPEVELGRPEPILFMFREFDEEEPHQAGQPYYTLSDLVKDSDLIVEGADVQPETADPAGAGEAVYTLQVSAVLRGNAAETVQVRVPADSGVLERSSEGRYLLFLRKEADGIFRPVSTSQGVYPIVRKFLHMPANDPCRMTALPIFHTSDNHFWYGVNDVREWIQTAVSSAPLS